MPWGKKPQTTRSCLRIFQLSQPVYIVISSNSHKQRGTFLVRWAAKLDLKPGLFAVVLISKCRCSTITLPLQPLLSVCIPVRHCPPLNSYSAALIIIGCSHDTSSKWLSATFLLLPALPENPWFSQPFITQLSKLFKKTLCCCTISKNVIGLLEHKCYVYFQWNRND